MAERSVKLLFDENFSHRQVEFVARESRLAEIQHVLKVGWSGHEDLVWIKRAVEAGFTVVTGDRNERTRGYAATDLKQMKARVVLVGGFFDHLGRWDRAKWLVARIEDLVREASSMQPGSVLLVSKYGRAQPI